MTKFLLPDISDKRLSYASEYLENMGFLKVSSLDRADFVLLGVNPTDFLEYNSKPTFAGNVCSNNVFDYTKEECFAIENAYLTAEAAVSLAISSSDISLINSSILIVGYGRIAKALHRYLSAFSSDISVCARSSEALSNARCNGSNSIAFSQLKAPQAFDFVFNTVPHPVINEAELRALKKGSVIVDLASFPGGVDKHFANSFGHKLIVARGLPGKYSPKTAGFIVGKTIENMISRKE